MKVIGNKTFKLSPTLSVLWLLKLFNPLNASGYHMYPQD